MVIFRRILKFWNGNSKKEETITRQAHTKSAISKKKRIGKPSRSSEHNHGIDNVDAFITRCRQEAKQKYGNQDKSDVSSDKDHDSTLLYYFGNDDEHSECPSYIESQEGSTLGTPSLSSEVKSYQDENECSSETSEITDIGESQHTDTTPIQNGDMPTESFLQLKGITVGNFNVKCNFHIAAALRVMIQY